MDKRIIKFRALDFNGNWQYGSYYVGVMYPTSFSGHYINNNQIDPQTVGQFTCLHDKTGKEIYEGDILVYSDGRMFVVEWNKNMAGMWARELKHYDNGLHGYGFEETEYYEWEVIGNIYENPKLIN